MENSRGLQAFHVVLTTDISRISTWMIKYGVIKGLVVNLCLVEEILLTKITCSMVNESGHKILAYNICRDHIHLLPVNQEEVLASIIQKIKSVGSKLFRRQAGLIPDSPYSVKGGAEKKHLWSQKFYRAALRSGK